MSYPALWESAEDLGTKIERSLPPENPMGSRGRPALPNRQVVKGILLMLRSGYQWKGFEDRAGTAYSAACADGTTPHVTPHIHYRAFATHPTPLLEPHRDPARR